MNDLCCVVDVDTLISRQYNNFYEGEFLLYEHKDLPFRVSTL